MHFMAEPSQLSIVMLLNIIFFLLRSNGEDVKKIPGMRCLILDEVINNVYFYCVSEGTPASVGAGGCRRPGV